MLPVLTQTQWQSTIPETQCCLLLSRNTITQCCSLLLHNHSDTVLLPSLTQSQWHSTTSCSHTKTVTQYCSLLSHNTMTQCWSLLSHKHSDTVLLPALTKHSDTVLLPAITQVKWHSAAPCSQTNTVLLPALTQNNEKVPVTALTQIKWHSTAPCSYTNTVKHSCSLLSHKHSDTVLLPAPTQTQFISSVPWSHTKIVTQCFLCSQTKRQHSDAPCSHKLTVSKCWSLLSHNTMTQYCFLLSHKHSYTVMLSTFTQIQWHIIAPCSHTNTVKQ